MLKLGGRCAYCGEQLGGETMTIDHVNPLSSTGTNAMVNLVPSCFDCNTMKGPFDINVFRQKLFQLPYARVKTPFKNRMLQKYDAVMYCQNFKEIVFYHETKE